MRLDSEGPGAELQQLVRACVGVFGGAAVTSDPVSPRGVTTALE